MLTIAFILVGVFAYLSSGYYIAKNETSKDLAVKSPLTILAYTFFGPFVVAAITYVQIIRFGIRGPAKAVGFLAKYLSKKKALKLKPKEDAGSLSQEGWAQNNSLAVQLAQQQAQEEAGRAKALEARPNAKVIRLQFPKKD